MDIFFETNSGQHRCSSPYMALVHWFMTVSRQRIYFFDPDPQRFVCQIVSALERTYNVRPHVSANLTFDEKCQTLLEFIHAHGSITKLTIKD